jgi:hypothetical protein
MRRYGQSQSPLFGLSGTMSRVRGYPGGRPSRRRGSRGSGRPAHAPGAGPAIVDENAHVLLIWRHRFIIDTYLTVSQPDTVAETILKAAK